MASTVRLDLASDLGGLLKLDGVAAEVHRVAERMASAARSSAPVATGAYQSGIEVVDEVHGDRAVSRVYAKAPHSLVVEAKTGNLSRAQDAGRT